MERQFKIRDRKPGVRELYYIEGSFINFEGGKCLVLKRKS